MPDFSVVIPTVARRELLAQALESVFNQTLAAHEVIVVIDRPAGVASDGTETMLAETYPQVKTLFTGGQRDAVARRAGVEAATGDWVCFLDDDDMWHREKLAVTAGHIASHPDCGAVRGTVWYFGADASAPTEMFGLQRDFVATNLEQAHAHAAESPPRNDFSYLDIHGRSLELMLERNRGVIHTSAVRRDVLLACRPVPSWLAAGGDWILLTEVARHTEWCLVDTGMAFYRLHSGQFSNDPAIAKATAQAIALQWERQGDAVTRALASYEPHYLPRLRHAWWDTLKARRWADAMVVWACARTVLPRRRTRVALLVPPVVADRWQLRT